MATADKINSVLIRHKESIAELEREIELITSSDLIAQNDRLASELAVCRQELDKVKEKYEATQKENKYLKNTLYDQILNERAVFLNKTKNKVNTYYEPRVEGERNRLLEFERSAIFRIDEMVKTLQSSKVSESDEIYQALSRLRNLVGVKVAKMREELEQQTKALSKNISDEFAALSNEKVTEETLQKRIKQNNLESLVGLNIINKLGIFLLIIGVITAGQFTYMKMSDMLKCVIAFAVGGVFLVAGELLSRRKANVFSLGITSGGIAILYVALVMGYFGYGLLPMLPALGLCILITVGALVLSLRYGSQTIAAFALIGGYLPILSISGSKSMIFASMAYFIILNTLALVNAANKKWRIAAFIGLALNTAGSAYIIMLMMFDFSPIVPSAADSIITILYLFFAFFIYLLIPVAAAFDKTRKFSAADVVFLALNTFISSVFLYAAFYGAKFTDYTGLFAVVMAAIYLALGRFIEKKLPKELQTSTLFYLSGLTFAILIVPFQFGRVWMSLGWLIEGVVVLIFGILRDIKRFQKGGAVICACCVGAFLLFDVLSFGSNLFVYKYSAITLGSILVLTALIYKKRFSGSAERYFKYGSAINLWIYLLYMIKVQLNDQIFAKLQLQGLNTGYLTGALSVLAGLSLAYTLPKSKGLRDTTMKMICGGIYIISFLSLFVLNMYEPIYQNADTGNMLIRIIGTGTLVLISALCIFAMKDLLYALVQGKKLGVEYYPLILAGYFLAVLTQNLVEQYSLSFNNAIISIVYVITAFALIIYGFIRRYKTVRLFALGLSMIAVAKLFLVDLAFLSKGYRVGSYFAFGVTLLAISFVYQYFNKRIQNRVEVLANEKSSVD